MYVVHKIDIHLSNCFSELDLYRSVNYCFGSYIKIKINPCRIFHGEIIYIIAIFKDIIV